MGIMNQRERNGYCWCPGQERRHALEGKREGEQGPLLHEAEEEGGGRDKDGGLFFLVVMDEGVLFSTSPIASWP